MIPLQVRNCWFCLSVGVFGWQWTCLKLAPKCELAIANDNRINYVCFDLKSAQGTLIIRTMESSTTTRFWRQVSSRPRNCGGSPKVSPQSFVFLFCFSWKCWKRGAAEIFVNVRWKRGGGGIWRGCGRLSMGITRVCVPQKKRKW